MADKTVNEGILETVKELKETNKKIRKSIESNNAMQSKVGGKIGDAVLENAKKSTEGLNSFIGELESLPVFGAISGIGKKTQWFCCKCNRLEKSDLQKKMFLISSTTWYH